MVLIIMLVVGYFVVRSIVRASCGARYYGQMPPPGPGYTPGPGYGPGPGYPGPGYGNYGYGGWGPGYYGGGGMWSGLLGGLGGAWLGNEMFGQHAAAPAEPGSTVATYDQSGNAIDPSSYPTGGDPPGGQAALPDGGGGGR